MQGVEILTSTQVVTEYAFGWTGFWFVFILTFAIGLIIGIKTGIDDGYLVAMVPICGTFLVCGFIFGGMVGDTYREPIKYTTEHKVTISDEVSMTEFYEHYTVIDQDGKIFTVREKTNER